MIKIKGKKILLTPIRALGEKDNMLEDLVFDKDSFILKGFVANNNFYKAEDVCLRGGVFIFLGEKTTKEDLDECLFYKKILNKKIYDEEGSVLGKIGDIEVDIRKMSVKGVEISDGLLVDLCFAREFLDVVHFAQMQMD